MAKNKLQRFEENETFKHLIQPTREEVLDNFSLKGKWNSDFFKSEKPIVLELGCGKGEYVLGLNHFFPDTNYIGVDVKGARLWRGAKTVQDENLANIAFLRTQIELIESAFEENEVAEIWITFPDPQIKFRRSKHRLTHLFFLEKYKRILKPDGIIHLKTDSEFLHGYTLGVLQEKEAEIIFSNHDVYHESTFDVPPEVVQIQTHYEKTYLKENKRITYLKFRFKTDN